MAYKADTITLDAFAVTPADGVNQPAFGFYVGGAGNVTVITGTGRTVTFVGCPVGAQLKLVIRSFQATGTTATSIVAFGPT